MSIAAAPLETTRAGRPWLRACAWLAVLGPLFYLTYGTANWLAGMRADVPTIVFDWERSVPFLAWTIIPYWSINLFYAASVFVCVDRRELDTHGRRLLTIQAICVVCFLLFPLRFSFERPTIEPGLPASLFDALLSFDKPFNQAPSLHIALCVILAALYARHVPGWLRPFLISWFALIGVSVLTTFQHHFVDIPTGLLAGLLCLWMWPDSSPSPLSRLRLTPSSKRRELALLYAGLASLLASGAFALGGWALWLLWPAVSCLMVAVSYALAGPAGFQSAGGTPSFAARWLFAPYTLAALVNSRLWTRKSPAPDAVADGVWIGRVPVRRAGAHGFAGIVDLCPEIPCRGGGAIVSGVPMLDLVVPEAAELRQAADEIERLRRVGPVLACCALGYGRSAAAVATWLLRTGRAATAGDALDVVRRARPAVVASRETLDRIAEAGSRS
jgi:hypothetical protein